MDLLDLRLTVDVFSPNEMQNNAPSNSNAFFFDH